MTIIPCPPQGTPIYKLANHQSVQSRKQNEGPILIHKYQPLRTIAAPQLVHFAAGKGGGSLGNVNWIDQKL